MKVTPNDIISKHLVQNLLPFGQLTSVKRIYDAMLALYEDTSSVLEEHHDHVELQQVDCQKGCGHCCRLNVSVLPVEALGILYYVQTAYTDAEKEVFFKLLRSAHVESYGLEDDERMVAGIKCVFLTAEGVCSIYAVRPLICRSVTSIDVNSCTDSFTAMAFGEEKTIMMNLLQKEFYDQIFSILGEQLKLNGYDDRSVSLLTALSVFQKPAAVKQFLNKENVKYFR